LIDQKPSKVTIQISGGLGNQLFEIFTLLGYALHQKCPYFLETKNMRGSRKTVYWNNFFQSLKPVLEQPRMIRDGIWSIQKRLNRFITIPPARQRVFHEAHYHYTPIPCFVGWGDVKMVGYFQSYKYFDKYKLDIFRLLELESRKNEIIQKTSYNYDNTVSLHFRIGDYKQQKDYHPLMPIEYYRCALSQLTKDTEKDSWNVLYFCEEEDRDIVSHKIRTLKKLFPSMNFEKINRELEDWEEMLAMSLCCHHVIANSTFSWWGAYLNSSNIKRVYYPSIWFGPKYKDLNTKDLFPESWHRTCIQKIR